MKEEFPPLDRVTMSGPCIIVDMQGIILTWYLPGVLEDFRQVGLFTLSNHSSTADTYQSAIMAATEKLNSLLEIRSNSGGSWRSDPELYYSGTQAPGGFVNISPAWYQLGHEVSVPASENLIDR